VAKKSVKKIVPKDADQYLLRLPSGLRERVARRAGENGRSMNTEIIDAIEKHLMDADRVTRLTEAFERHLPNIETIDLIYDAVYHLENRVRTLTGGEYYGVLNRARDEELKAARQAKLPPITAEQAAKIRELINESGFGEDSFLRTIGAASIEEIKDFERAEAFLKRWSFRSTDVRL
jgi:predicted DNA-binding protein